MIQTSLSQCQGGPSLLLPQYNCLYCKSGKHRHTFTIDVCPVGYLSPAVCVCVYNISFKKASQTSCLDSIHNIPVAIVKFKSQICGVTAYCPTAFFFILIRSHIVLMSKPLLWNVKSRENERWDGELSDNFFFSKPLILSFSVMTLIIIIARASWRRINTFSTGPLSNFTEHRYVTRKNGRTF